MAKQEGVRRRSAEGNRRLHGRAGAAGGSFQDADKGALSSNRGGTGIEQAKMGHGFVRDSKKECARAAVF